MNLDELRKLENWLSTAVAVCAQHGRGDCVHGLNKARNALPALIRVTEAAEAVMRESAHSGFYSGSSASARLDLEIALRALEEQ